MYVFLMIILYILSYIALFFLGLCIPFAVADDDEDTILGCGVLTWVVELGILIFYFFCPLTVPVFLELHLLLVTLVMLISGFVYTFAGGEKNGGIGVVAFIFFLPLVVLPFGIYGTTQWPYNSVSDTESSIVENVTEEVGATLMVQEAAELDLETELDAVQRMLESDIPSMRRTLRYQASQNRDSYSISNSSRAQEVLDQELMEIATHLVLLNELEQDKRELMVDLTTLQRSESRLLMINQLDPRSQKSLTRQVETLKLKIQKEIQSQTSDYEMGHAQQQEIALLYAEMRKR